MYTKRRFLIVPPPLVTYSHCIKDSITSTYKPADAPGTLKEDEYWAVLAFLLKENGVYQGDKPLGRDNAAGISLKR